jgi:hypothetical protein
MSNLLVKINAAVKEANQAEATVTTAQATVTTAQAELVARSKTVGLLLLEAKHLHPAVKDFDAFLKKVDGLKRSRAYDYMRIAGGRATDEELKKDARDRVRKHREKKKSAKSKELPKPTAVPEAKPNSVTTPHVTESREVSIDQRRRVNEALDADPNAAQEQWQRSLSHHAGEAVAMPAFWRREFGEWEKFEAPPDLMTLAEQAAETWKKLVADLRARQPQKARAA